MKRCLVVIALLLLLLTSCGPQPGIPLGARRVEAQVPIRMQQGRQADIYLSFGPQDMPGLQREPSMITSEGQVIILGKGHVKPKLDGPGFVQIQSIDTEPVDVDSPVAKRWHWVATVPLTETLTSNTIKFSPSLVFYHSDSAKEMAIWPEAPVILEIPIDPKNKFDAAIIFARESKELLAIAGLTWAGIVSGCVVLAKRFVVRLRAKLKGFQGSKRTKSRRSRRT